MTIFFCVYQIASHRLLPYDEYEGVGRLATLLLTAKFNYFNMSFGVLGGCAAGIYLEKHREEDLSVLSWRFWVLGTSCICLGLLVLYLRSGTLHSLGADDSDMGLWRWLLYPGAAIVLAGLVATVLNQWDKLPSIVRRGCEIISIFGQSTFPIFIAHMLVWNLKPILVKEGVSEPMAAALLLVAFIGFCSWFMSSLFQLYYGKQVREA
jgi:hypothetical protein